MRDWFERLNTRERTFVAIGTIVTVVALFYVLVYQPLDRNQQAAANNVLSWQRSLAELRPLKSLTGSSFEARDQSQSSTMTPVVIVDQTLRARGLDGSLQRSQPTATGGIRVEFENVAFDDLVLWLGDLSQQHALQVSSASLSSSQRTGPGRINATLTLERTT